MLMHLIIALLFIITVFLAFAEDNMEKSHKIIILVGYAIFMIILAATKSIDNTADAKSYEQMFYGNDDMITEIATEPTYIYLSRIVLAMGGTVWVMFFIYAIITIPAKLKALNDLTPYIFTALMVYIPVYFELHDMVQIRAAAAATFLLSSLIPLSNKQYLVAGLLLVIAVLFHYSSLIFLPFLLLGNRKLSTTWRIGLASFVVLCFVMYLTGRDIFHLIPSSFVSGKIDVYQDTSEKGEWEMALLYKNVYYMIKFVLLFVCLYYYDYIVERDRKAPLIINIFAASILTPMLISSVPIIATRTSDLYGIVDGIVFTYLLLLISPRYAAKACIAIVGMYMIIYNMIVTEYFT